MAAILADDQGAVQCLVDSGCGRGSSLPGWSGELLLLMIGSIGRMLMWHFIVGNKHIITLHTISVFPVLTTIQPILVIL